MQLPASRILFPHFVIHVDACVYELGQLFSRYGVVCTTVYLIQKLLALLGRYVPPSYVFDHLLGFFRVDTSTHICVILVPDMLHEIIQILSGLLVFCMMFLFVFMTVVVAVVVVCPDFLGMVSTTPSPVYRLNFCSRFSLFLSLSSIVSLFS